MGGARFRFENGSYNSSENRVLAPPISGVGLALPDSGDPGGKCDVLGVFLLLPGMLLCVGCPVAGTYPQDFDSPIDLDPV
jgi:hypothetical protein